MAEHDQIELRRWALELASRQQPGEPATTVVERARTFEEYVTRVKDSSESRTSRRASNRRKA